MKKILYHYTDFHALNGILCDRELRVNNVLNMNDAEEMQLLGPGFIPVTLGPRILRTETAGLAAASAILALSGEME